MVLFRNVWFAVVTAPS